MKAKQNRSMLCSSSVAQTVYQLHKQTCPSSEQLYYGAKIDFGLGDMKQKFISRYFLADLRYRGYISVFGLNK